MSGTQINRLALAGILAFVLSSAAFGLSESTGPGGSNAQAVHTEGYKGQNIHIGFISVDNVLTSHEAFFEKDEDNLPNGPQHAFIHDVLGEGARISNHDTELAGILISSGGQAYPDQIGLAPSSYLHNVRVADENDQFSSVYLQDALDELVLNQGCRIIVTGFQLPVLADGTTLWTLMYDYYAYRYDIIFANATGNYSSTHPGIVEVSVFGDAYNGITTAGLINIDSTALYDQVGTLSLPGVTVDGRHKPEVCAPSPDQTVPSSASDTSWTTTSGTPQGYTSWSVPHTAGVAALLLDYAEDNGTADDEHSEVIKAVMVNTTFPNILDEFGNNTVYPMDPNRAWNEYRGYGRLDAYRALELLRSPRVSPGASTTDSNGWAYETLPAGQSHSYIVEGFINERLLATATWPRQVVWNDPPGLGHGFIETEELISSTTDLDLEIYDPDGTLLTPQPSGYDIDDNLEKWDLLLPKTGMYEIRLVNQSSSESATYGLAFEILEPLAGDVHTDYIVDLKDVSDLTFYWLSTNCNDPMQACYGYNLSPDDTIDLSDLTILIGNWLATDGRYYPSN